MSKNYTIGKQVESWKGNTAQSLTFIVTADCNLRCKYCYITHKSSNKRMSFEVARKFIDYVLNSPIHKQEAVILDFIGGEPLLETRLIDQICDYFKLKTYKMNHDWFWNYRINICTNGVNYSDVEVQRFIKKNYGKLSLGITIDGTKKKHDLQRVFPDGSGSYDVIKKNIPLWLEQFEGATKVTFASEDLCYLKESIIELWEMGIKDIAANVVFENVWKPEDDKIFENQLKELADYIIENDLYDKYSCTLFDDYIGSCYSEDDLINTSCGAGKMLAVDPDGNLYPCMRYYDYSLNNKKGYVIGDIDNGVDFEKVRPFGTLMYKYQSDEECLNCDIATGCTFCQGFNYDEAETNTNFVRTKYICKMHKARVRANDYYFSLLLNKKGIDRERKLERKRQMYFLLANDVPSICSYNCGKTVEEMYMSEEQIMKGLEYCRENFITPVFVHGRKFDNYNESKKYEQYTITHIYAANGIDDANLENDSILVCDNSFMEADKQDNIIFNISAEEIKGMAKKIIFLMGKVNRININIQNISPMFDFFTYEKELEEIANMINNYLVKEGVLKEINILTDIFFLKKHENCVAGTDLLTYAPNGKIYICPAEYFENSEKGSVGDLNTEIKIPNRHLYTKEYAPICRNCSAYQCENCFWINKKYTYEVSVSPSFQCKKAMIENKISYKLQKKIGRKIECYNQLDNDGFKDPYLKMDGAGTNLGYYTVM